MKGEDEAKQRFLACREEIIQIIYPIPPGLLGPALDVIAMRLADARGTQERLRGSHNAKG